MILLPRAGWASSPHPSPADVSRLESLMNDCFAVGLHAGLRISPIYFISNYDDRMSQVSTTARPPSHLEVVKWTGVGGNVMVSWVALVITLWFVTLLNWLFTAVDCVLNAVAGGSCY